MDEQERQRLAKEAEEWRKNAPRHTPEDARRLNDKWRVDGQSITPDMIVKKN